MWPLWQAEKRRITATLQLHAQQVQTLPGIKDALVLDVLATQFVASLRREAYYKCVQQKSISSQRADPNHGSFDAERAVAYHVQHSNIDEAAWLVFLMTHFGKPADMGWIRLRDVYGRLGGGIWDWRTVSANPGAFGSWLAKNWQNIGGKFGNHRKYETLRPGANREMSKVVDSYVAWVGRAGHRRFFADFIRRGGNDPYKIFAILYNEMPVVSFGRLAKFDFLSTIGRYGIAPIEAGSAYLDGATGPASGARLLFDGSQNGQSTNEELQKFLDVLDEDLKVGMKVIEDALCNWQKSPKKFIHFKG